MQIFNPLSSMNKLHSSAVCCCGSRNRNYYSDISEPAGQIKAKLSARPDPTFLEAEWTKPKSWSLFCLTWFPLHYTVVHHLITSVRILFFCDESAAFQLKMLWQHVAQQDQADKETVCSNLAVAAQSANLTSKLKLLPSFVLLLGFSSICCASEELSLKVS